MVWFQCEDCGENLKKPKLLNHFNRCSAHKLSCIDCGVIFDQQSVQAHTSCVTEEEKYGPKGLNRSGSGSSSKANNGKEKTGPAVDASRGLSTFPPWSCSLCNVKATSRETLELHAQGKKHQSRAKAAAAREKSTPQDGGTQVVMDLTKDLCKDELKDVGEKGVQGTSTLDATSLSVEKKRKERTDEADDVVSQEIKVEKLDKKLKRATSTVVAKSSKGEEGERLPNVACDSQEKKRKHVEEQQEIVRGEGEKGSGKKSRRKDKVATIQVNGHDNNALIAEISGADGKVEDGEQVKKKEKRGRLKDGHGASVNDSEGQSLGIEDNDDGEKGLSVHETDAGDTVVNGNYSSGKKSKKSKRAVDADDTRAFETSAKLQEDNSPQNSRKEKRKKPEKKEAILHEVSFREWLGGESNRVQDDTSTPPPSGDMVKRKKNLQQLEISEKTREALHKLEKAGLESTQDGITKVVKWRKIIREILGKLVQSVNGKLKKKDLKRDFLPMAQKAMEESDITFDRKLLKAELMRQVNSSPKFVVEGKHVMLAPKVK